MKNLSEHEFPRIEHEFPEVHRDMLPFCLCTEDVE